VINTENGFKAEGSYAEGRSKKKEGRSIMYLLQTSLHQTFGMELLYHLLPDKTNLQLETWHLEEALF